MIFFKCHSAKKELKEAIKYAELVRNMQCDTVPKKADEEMIAAIKSAKFTLRNTKDIAEITTATNLLQKLFSNEPWHKVFKNKFAENVEIFLVAVGVAMAFRTYFFEPFKIPTGSMQPTLYGIYSEEKSAPAFYEKGLLKYISWLITGTTYKEFRVKKSGTLSILPQKDPGYYTISIAGYHYNIPTDAAERIFKKHANEIRNGKFTLKKGDILWAGLVHSGDHLFVNRMSWNFRKPRRGDVMVFTTTGIQGLPPGTHYIKRMVGLPNETISIKDPTLFVNGTPVTEPKTIARICEKSHTTLGENGYNNYQGYRTIGTSAPAPSPNALRTPRNQITLSPTEYLGMGDNTLNSYDGRYWGAVPESNLVGPASFVFWPFTSKRLGLIK